MALVVMIGLGLVYPRFKSFKGTLGIVNIQKFLLLVNVRIWAVAWHEWGLKTSNATTDTNKRSHKSFIIYTGVNTSIQINSLSLF